MAQVLQRSPERVRIPGVRLLEGRELAFQRRVILLMTLIPFIGVDRLRSREGGRLPPPAPREIDPCGIAAEYRLAVGFRK